MIVNKILSNNRNLFITVLRFLILSYFFNSFKVSEFSDTEKKNLTFGRKTRKLKWIVLSREVFPTYRTSGVS